MRKAVLMKALEDVEVEEGFDWRELAVNTEGYSCGDVVELCREVRARVFSCMRGQGEGNIRTAPFTTHGGRAPHPVEGCFKLGSENYSKTKRTTRCRIALREIFPKMPFAGLTLFLLLSNCALKVGPGGVGSYVCSGVCNNVL